MTVVNPKSISGINSITMASGSDNLLTIHTTNTTERVRVNSDGDVIVGSGITVSPDGNIFATGVTTATTFVGALTGNVTGNVTGNQSGGTVSATSAAVADLTSGRVVLAGSSGELQDDSSLLFGSNQLTVHEAKLKGNQLLFEPSGTAYVDHSTTGQDIQFRTSVSSSLDTTGPTIKSTGNIAFASGKGIDFSATGDASGMDNELLDDYEEGSWTPTARNQGSFTSALGRYVKIGQQVTVWAFIPTVTNNTSNDTLQVSGLPYTVASGGATEYVGSLMIRFLASTGLTGVSFNCYTYSGRDFVEFYACRDDDNNYEAILHSDLAYTNSNGIRFCLTYVV